MTEHQRLSPIPLPGGKGYDLKAMAKKAAETAEREHIKNTLIYTNWNRKAAAKLLQISYKALLYKIEKYGLTHLTPIEDLRTKE
jgi:transcriptional regulator with PAS, ATPase and Fis domain